MKFKVGQTFTDICLLANTVSICQHSANTLVMRLTSGKFERFFIALFHEIKIHNEHLFAGRKRENNTFCNFAITKPLCVGTDSSGTCNNPGSLGGC